MLNMISLTLENTDAMTDHFRIQFTTYILHNKIYIFYIEWIDSLSITIPLKWGGLSVSGRDKIFTLADWLWDRACISTFWPSANTMYF